MITNKAVKDDSSTNHADQITETVKESYLQQLNLLKDINEKMIGFKDVWLKIQQNIDDMNAERLTGVDSLSFPITKMINIDENQVKVEMDSDGEYRSYVDENEVNLIEWLQAKNQNV